MLKSIEERMEDQLIEKDKQRFTDASFHTNWASKVNNHYDEPGQYTSEDFKAELDRLSKDNREIGMMFARSQISLDHLIGILAAAVLLHPNDQELGAAIRKWYNQTEGKFI